MNDQVETLKEEDTFRLIVAPITTTLPGAIDEIMILDSGESQFDAVTPWADIGLSKNFYSVVEIGANRYLKASVSGRQLDPARLSRLTRQPSRLALVGQDELSGSVHMRLFPVATLQPFDPSLVLKSGENALVPVMFQVNVESQDLLLDESDDRSAIDYS